MRSGESRTEFESLSNLWLKVFYSGESHCICLVLSFPTCKYSGRTPKSWILSLEFIDYVSATLEWIYNFTFLGRESIIFIWIKTVVNNYYPRWLLWSLPDLVFYYCNRQRIRGSSKQAWIRVTEDRHRSYCFPYSATNVEHLWVVHLLPKSLQGPHSHK